MQISKAIIKAGIAKDKTTSDCTSKADLLSFLAAPNIIGTYDLSEEKIIGRIDFDLDLVNSIGTNKVLKK